MTAIESIYEIKGAVLDLQRYLLSKDAVVTKRAQTKYRQLVDRFCRENESLVAPQLRHSCLDDLDCFLNLMESTTEYYYLES
ncbi:MAG: hypothetical protein ABSC54_10375 [Smithellaceae bacterium]|jgi:hypothetical protein